MNTNSNSYTMIYASVMVIIVAFLLAFVSSSLKSTQDKNVQLDTKKQILAALNIKNVEDADAEYQKYVKGDMLMNVDGTLTENTGEFATNYEKEAKEQQRLHVFVCEVDGNNGSGCCIRAYHRYHCYLSYPEIRARCFRVGIFADHCIYPCHCSIGTDGGNHFEEGISRPLSGIRSLSSVDYY